MKINLRAPTVHAIRILKYMGQCQSANPAELIMGKDVADAVKVTHSYFMRVVRELIKGGLVRSVQGRLGGFQLARNLNDISLYEVMEVIESEGLHEQNRQEGLTSLDRRLEEIAVGLETQLRGIKLSDL